MVRHWLSVRIELLGGRGEQLWPYPGRIFAVGPSHTFRDFARAINDAFGRWDLSHLSMFTLADGRLVTDVDTGAELSSPSGPAAVHPLDIDDVRVLRTVEPGAVFRYVFDLGDDWTHCCTVDTERVDPEEVLGVVPAAPMAYWGWGSLPDQYGRRWDGDDGERGIPVRPRRPHPMTDGTWPDTGEPAAAIDLELEDHQER